ncbi:MAG TPA: carboxypeptidase-like regulatory domain-containing protein [Thermoanaerobaculia bacterium]|nr:carboxypeptidase-like regulatory domain-containing protein [Thermoanaerobaculia bacterium]
MCKAILLALALATPLLAQPARPATGRVGGIVVIGDVPLPGATVTIRFGSEVHTILTAADGRFVYDRIPLGAVVKISAEMESLKPQKRTVALTSAAASRDFTFAMKLSGETITTGCSGLRPVDEPNTYYFLQTDLDKLPVARSIDAVLDLLPGTH